MPSRGPRWSEDEVRVLTAIYFSSRFSIGDDAQEECQLIADCFGRTPGSVDRQWRNISSILEGQGQTHVGRIVKDCVREYLDDPAACTEVARLTMLHRGWSLHEILENGNVQGAFRDATDSSEAQNLRLRLLEVIPQIDYRIFPSGSHGYALEIEVDSETKRFQTVITCVLVDSSHAGIVDMKTTRADVVSELEHLVMHTRIRQSRNGRLTIHDSRRFVLHGERFNVSIRMNQSLRRNS